MKRKLVTVRMPKEVERFVARVAKLAGTSPTNVYNMMLATAIVHLDIRRPTSTRKKV